MPRATPAMKEAKKAVARPKKDPAMKTTTSTKAPVLPEGKSAKAKALAKQGAKAMKTMKVAKAMKAKGTAKENSATSSPPGYLAESESSAALPPPGPGYREGDPPYITRRVYKISQAADRYQLRSLEIDFMVGVVREEWVSW